VEYFGYDFQPDHAADSGDLEAAVTPLVSAHWSTLFTWDGSGPMPQDERDRLDDIADSVHEAGARLRLWGAPDGPGTDRANLWATLTAAGVDYINTDHLRAYASLSGR
jgi:glycerophosphoryl diester phosphodiesterase